eukprot:19036-Heterococcus_DN1.PRE.3
MNAHRTPSVHQRTESTIAPPSPRPSIKLCHAHYLLDQGSSDSPANHQLRKFPECHQQAAAGLAALRVYCAGCPLRST